MTVDHPNAKFAQAKRERKMIERRLAMLRFSLKHEYNTELAAEVIALTARIADLEKMLASKAA